MDGRIVIAVESCPGGGKGFLLKHLAAHGLPRIGQVGVLLLDDSIEHVIDAVHDPKRWTLTTELHFLIEHVRMLKSKSYNDITFVEGSPLTDLMCYFAPAQKHPLEDNLYKEWYELLRPMWSVDVHVLLTSSPHEHLERIIGNSKKEQSNTTILSLYRQEERYKSVLRTHPTLVCHANFEDNEPAMEIMKAQLSDIVQMLKNKSLYTTR